MKMLFTGKGGSGSWAVRAEQLGEAIGATVKPHASLADVSAADVVVVVKRTPRDVIECIQATGRPWVFDLVDCYPQPKASQWTRSEAIAWVHAKLDELRPNGVIWPTRRMREDCDTGLPGIVLPHHCRTGLKINPIRDEIATVGYEGRADYLAEWHPMLERICAERGWRFVVNPPVMADLDVVVALRGGQWNGYVQKHWKSGVKLANAHGSGTPFIGQPESGYEETASGAEYWATDERSLRTAFDWLGSKSAREQVSERFMQAAFPVERAAQQLKGFLRGF